MPDINLEGGEHRDSHPLRLPKTFQAYITWKVPDFPLLNNQLLKIQYDSLHAQKTCHQMITYL